MFHVKQKFNNLIYKIMKISNSYHLDSMSELTSEFVEKFLHGSSRLAFNQSDDNSYYYVSCSVVKDVDDVTIFTPHVSSFEESVDDFRELVSYLSLNDICVSDVKYYHH